MRFKENSSLFRVKFNVEFPSQVMNFPTKYTHEKTIMFIQCRLLTTFIFSGFVCY